MAVTTSPALMAQDEALSTTHAMPPAAPARPDLLLPRPSELQGWLHAQEIDLADQRCLDLLTQLSRHWPELSPVVRSLCLRDKHFTISAPAPQTSDVVLLPGGIVALRRPEGVLVPDPISAVVFSAAEAERLRAAVSKRSDAVSLVHEPLGVTSRSRLPRQPVAQCVTVLAEGNRLPRCAQISGPVLVNWCDGGAVAWAMRAAPPLAALAVHASAIPLLTGTTPVAAEMWAAHGVTACRELIAPGIAECANDLLLDEICEELRCDILARCIDGSSSLAGMIADLLTTLPSCFHADPEQARGCISSEWQNGETLLQEAGPDHALFGLEAIADASRLIELLCLTFPPSQATLCLETGKPSRGVTVPIDSEAAKFLARRAVRTGRLALIVPTDGLAPTDLYGLANSLTLSGVTVTMFAPAWGFRHRIAPGGQEAGNAAWFGMGPGLDELEVLAADDFAAL